MRSSTRLLFFCYVSLCQALPGFASEKLTLQLKWAHGAFQFAGYYAAKEKGFYSDAGLDVEIEDARPDIDPIKRVLDGQAQYGIGYSGLLLARHSGKPVVVLAVVHQHSPMALASRKKDTLKGVHSLLDSKVMVYAPELTETLAYFKAERIPLERITFIEHNFDYHALLDGRVDASSVFVTNELYYLDQAHFPYQLYTPRSAGIDFYGDNLFTTEQELKDHPERVEAFRAASMRGWQYAMEHTEEIIDLILAKYPGVHDKDFYRFESEQMKALMQPDLIEVGYMNPVRWRHIADVYASLDLLPRDYPLDGFLYRPTPKFNVAQLYPYILPGVGILLTITLLSIYLTRQTAARRAWEERLQLQLEMNQINEERQKLIGQELHDGLGQQLSGADCLLARLQRRLQTKSAADAAATAEIGSVLEEAIDTVRTLARGLFPTALEAGGLAAALRHLAATSQNSSGIRCSFQCLPALTIHDQALALTLYRIAQEAVTNALRHSQAQAVDIHLSKQGDRYRLEITDNGQGLPAKPDLDSTSLGLRSMRNRAKLAKAHIEINNRPDGGLSIVITGLDQRREQAAQKHLLP
jgi:signal transduction histidine kinase